MALSFLPLRVVASLAASLVLFASCILLLSAQPAFAADLPPIRAESDQPLNNQADRESIDNFEPSYQPDFAFFDRSIIGRAASGVTPLKNNQRERLNLNAGQSACYVFTTGTVTTQDDTTDTTSKSSATESASSSASASAGSNGKRDTNDNDGENTPRADTSSQTLYISGNTCLQPTQTDKQAEDSLPGQLILAVSTPGATGCPRTIDEVPQDHKIEFEEGSGSLSVQTEGDVFVSVFAPNVSKGFDGVFNFEVTASTDDYFHQYIPSSPDTAQLLWFDSDSSAALLTTQNLTSESNDYEKYMGLSPLPFNIFVENDNFKMFDGLRHSVCGMRKQARSYAQDLLKTQMTQRGLGGKPKQEFYFDGLNSSTTYYAVLVRMGSDPKETVSKETRATNDQEEEEDNEGNGKVGGGGVVFDAVQFDTLSGSTCKILNNLDFCTDVQYAAPGNGKLNSTELMQKYDNYAQDIFENFKKVMMQVPCDADNTSTYSLVTNCSLCHDAYKKWLCAVSVPRCVDYSNDNPYALPRNINESFPNGTMVPEDEIRDLNPKLWNNRSRNQFIDQEIAPGPYKEILPCDDLCYNVVQKCPASITFTCPKPSYPGFGGSYRRREDADDDFLQCNVPGEALTQVSGARMLMPLSTVVLLSVLAMLVG